MIQNLMSMIVGGAVTMTDQFPNSFKKNEQVPSSLMSHPLVLQSNVKANDTKTNNPQVNPYEEFDFYKQAERDMKRFCEDEGYNSILCHDAMMRYLTKDTEEEVLFMLEMWWYLQPWELLLKPLIIWLAFVFTCVAVIMPDALLDME